MNVETGYVHSIYTGGMVDGPGIRTVVFFAGCSLRCIYCHNPDTWQRAKGMKKTVSDVRDEVLKYKSYYKFSGGGITVSGGEPTDQPDFLRELLKTCRENGIHTVLDTAGCATEKIADDVLPYVDLLLLDFKTYNADLYYRLTQSDIKRPLLTVEKARALNIPTQINYVLVPGFTDNKDDLVNLAAFLKTHDNIKKIEVLPFHKHGEHKWEGLDYVLHNTQPPTVEVLETARGLLGLDDFPSIQ